MYSWSVTITRFLNCLNKLWTIANCWIGGLAEPLEGRSTNIRKHQTKLHRAQQSAIFRLRTQHTTLNTHLHRIKKDHSAACFYCPDSDETTEHFLLHCPQYNDIRPPHPTIDNTLYGPTTQHQKTASFYKSAMNRRDITVQNLRNQER